ncbi:MAG TPA: glycoside hydrolase family 88 protein [Puia sp.]|jgi:rhamnogalacturonyl hydrolase YesR|nr:glycoside hydrolase family 88 protein [Puia sp.]
MAKWPDLGVTIITDSLFFEGPNRDRHPSEPSHVWNRAVYYEGLMALYSIDPDKKYYDYAVEWGMKHQWMPVGGVETRLADDQCAGQTWIDLYGVDAQPERIRNIKESVDRIVRSDKSDEWYWIDALQMAMPVFVRLGVLEKDTSYFRKMYDLYHHTKMLRGGQGLYSATEHLWWRDKNYLPPYKEPNGQDCFWSRGNGWVLAALVRVLSWLPVNDPHRAEYLQDYLDMVNALVPLQRPDGYWNVSLHDSTHFGGRELTGTALFTYGIAWGIREGWLDNRIFLPVVARAWNGMVEGALHANGMLGYVQGTAEKPEDGQPLGYDKRPNVEDFGLGCFLLAGSEVYQIATPPAANEDESKVPPYAEPELGLTTAAAWEVSGRAEVYRLMAKNVYGRMPVVKIPVVHNVAGVDTTALDGLAIRKSITLEFLPGDTAARLHVVLYLPKRAAWGEKTGKAGKAPVFVGYSFTPNNVTEHATQWPLKEIIKRGYAVAVAWYEEIEPDRADGWQTGVRTKLAGLLHIEPYEWGAIGAWAWGLERMADYLGTEVGVDTARMVVIGHSRLGKTALWAAANDQRFAMAISNESGEGGAAMGKRDYGETIAIINDYFPWWFAPAYKQWGSNPAEMPFDQYMLLGLVAPRPLYVASAMGDQWSDPKGEFLSAKLAGQVYSLYGEKGVGVDSMPALEKPVGDFIRYHIRNGKHDLTWYDWQQYLDFAERRLGKPGDRGMGRGK